MDGLTLPRLLGRANVIAALVQFGLLLGWVLGRCYGVACLEGFSVSEGRAGSRPAVVTDWSGTWPRQVRVALG